MAKLTAAIYRKFFNDPDNPSPVDPLVDDRLTRIRGEIDEIGKLLTEKIHELTLAAKESEEVVSNRIKHSEETAESLWREITALEAKLRQAETTAYKKDTAVQKTEDTLRDEIHKLQDELTNKQQELELKINEVNGLKSKNDHDIGQLSELQSVIAQNKLDAEKESARHEDVARNLKENMDLLEVRFRGEEEISRGKDVTIQRLEQQLTTKTQDFESQISGKEKLLSERDAEIKDLKSQLQFLSRGIKDTSSFFRQAVAFAHRQPEEENDSTIDPINRERHNPITPSSPSTSEEMVPSEFLEQAVEHLTLSIGPIAPIVMRDHIKALGESTEKFPKRRVAELIEMLSNEIAHTDLRFSFRNWFAQRLLTA